MIILSCFLLNKKYKIIKYNVPGKVHVHVEREKNEIQIPTITWEKIMLELNLMSVNTLYNGYPCSAQYIITHKQCL